MAKPPRITLYTTSRCPNCKQAGAFLRQHGIRFQSFDVENNRRASVEFQRHGGRSVPLIVIGDQTITGFDPKRLRKVLSAMGFQLS